MDGWLYSKIMDMDIEINWIVQNLQEAEKKAGGVKDGMQEKKK